MENNLPVWVTGDLPKVWLADQFLHAYYYSEVREGLEIDYEKNFQINKSNPHKALRKAINWWKSQDVPPAKEDQTLYEYAPYIRKHLREDKISDLTMEEFSKICRYTHATVSHYIKLRPSFLGEFEKKELNKNERAPLFAEWILKQKNEKGWDIKRLLHFVLYEGSADMMWERLYLAGMDKNYCIPHYKLNSLSELVGWARPEISPPRNGRTSKALRALGYDVKVYS